MRLPPLSFTLTLSFHIMSNSSNGSTNVTCTATNGVVPPISSEGARRLVFHISILLLAIITLLTLIRLLLALSCVWRAAEWASGHFLWHTSDRPPIVTKRLQRIDINTSTSFREGLTHKRQKADATDDSHTLYSSHQAGIELDRSYRQNPVDYPPHMSTIPRFLNPVAALLRKRIAPGCSIARASVLVIYFSVLVYGGLYKSSPFTDPVRTGWLAVSQIPFVIAFASKNNILGMLLGFTYEKVISSTYAVVKMI